MEKYEVMEEIGRGSRGYVYLVKNRTTGVICAMKVYEGRASEAERELLVLKTIKNKGIPYLIDCIRSDEKIEIIMEYVTGKTLKRLMDERSFTEKSVANIALELLLILKDFHMQTPAWVYCDLKPENIMITEQSEVKLIDFGSVVIGREKNHELLGTRRYRPIGNPQISVNLDLYAWGSVLYELLTGYTYAEGIKNHKADLSYFSIHCKNALQAAVQYREDEVPDMERLEKEVRMWVNDVGMDGARNAKKEKKNYLIGDVKRLIKHGYKGVVGEVLLGLLIIVGALFLKEHMSMSVNAATQVKHYAEDAQIIDTYTSVFVQMPEIGNTANPKYVYANQSEQNGDEKNFFPDENDANYDKYGRMVLYKTNDR